MLTSQHVITVTYESASRYAHRGIERYSYHRIDSVLALSILTHLERRKKEEPDRLWDCFTICITLLPRGAIAYTLPMSS